MTEPVPDLKDVQAAVNLIAENLNEFLSDIHKIAQGFNITDEGMVNVLSLYFPRDLSREYAITDFGE